MADFLAPITTFLAQAVSWMGTILYEVTNNNALLVMVLAMPVIGFAVGLLKRLVRM